MTLNIIWTGHVSDTCMTEYELATLFFQIADTAHAIIANFLTIVFAMIVVSYLVAHRLDLISTSLLLDGLTPCSRSGWRSKCSISIATLSNLAGSWRSITMRIRPRLGWMGMATDLSDGPNQVIPAVTAIVCVIALPWLDDVLCSYAPRQSIETGTTVRYASRLNRIASVYRLLRIAATINSTGTAPPASPTRLSHRDWQTSVTIPGTSPRP